MKFYYDVIETHCVEVDFQKIYEHVMNDPYVHTRYDAYLEFIDNCDYYLEKIYKIDDLVCENNNHAIQELIDSWEAWLEETFGKNWDEV